MLMMVSTKTAPIRFSIICKVHSQFHLFAVVLQSYLHCVDHGVGQKFINRTHILGEPVQNPSRCVGVEKSHHRLADALEHSVVQSGLEGFVSNSGGSGSLWIEQTLLMLSCRWCRRRRSASGIGWRGGRSVWRRLLCKRWWSGPSIFRGALLLVSRRRELLLLSPCFKIEQTYTVFGKLINGEHWKIKIILGFLCVNVIQKFGTFRYLKLV